MFTFLRETIGILEALWCYPISRILHGREKARQVLNRRIDRALGV